MTQIFALILWYFSLHLNTAKNFFQSINQSFYCKHNYGP